jgi:ABC-2 type transport system ATP-binding protein
LYKKFELTRAVSGVSFDVERGSVFGLLGPNGAGKTTIANLLIGNHEPDSGTVHFRVNGHVTSRLPDRAVGYFPGDSGVYMSLPIARILQHAAMKRGLPQEVADQAVGLWLERLGLRHRANTSLSNLSKGNQQKVQLAEAVLHNPAIVFLDEPFAGLDPVNQEFFIGMIRQLQQDGTTILISDHQMAIMERIVDQVLILKGGVQIAYGTLDEVRERAQAGLKIRVRLADPRAPLDLAPFVTHPSIRAVERTAGGELRLLTTANAHPVEVLNFAKTRLRISEILSEPASLHDVYIHLVGMASLLANAE